MVGVPVVGGPHPFPTSPAGDRRLRRVILPGGSALDEGEGVGQSSADRTPSSPPSRYRRVGSDKGRPPGVSRTHLLYGPGEPRTPTPSGCSCGPSRPAPACLPMTDGPRSSSSCQPWWHETATTPPSSSGVSTTRNGAWTGRWTTTPQRPRRRPPRSHSPKPSIPVAPSLTTPGGPTSRAISSTGTCTRPATPRGPPIWPISLLAAHRASWCRWTR